MIKIDKKNKITMTRGDTLITDIAITWADGTTYEPEPTDVLRFALKKDYNDAQPLILKTIPIDTLQLRLDPLDTKSLEQPGTYCYDIQLTYADGIVATIVSKGTFELSEEVE